MKQTFVAKGLDQFEHEIDTGILEWSTTGGEIGPDGLFNAGTDEGNFTVTAKSKNIVCTVEVVIDKEETPTREIPPKMPGRLTWSGEVAPQKWTNLYMKVLTKFVSSGDLRIHVSVEALLNEAVPEQQVEETKAALRGLGLDDNVETQ